MTKLKKIIPWLLVVLWMALIFFLSHQPATQSASLSAGVMERILRIIEKIAPNATFDLEMFHYFVRKNAHFFAYMVLGMLVANGLRTIGYFGLNGYQAIGLAILICVLYAISDEFHQLFIPGRAGQIKDVLIDSAGSIVGVLAYSGVGLACNLQ